MAGLAVGLYAGLDDLRRVWKKDLSLTPQMAESDRQAALRGWHRAVKRSMRWAELEAED